MNGKNNFKEHTQKAIGNAIRQEFYQSDAVKQFHRELLFTETLHGRAQQRQKEQMIAHNTNGATQTMADCQRAERERAEQERRRDTQQNRDKQASPEELRQQVTAKDNARHQMALEKEKERQRCNELEQQFQQERRQLQQKKRKQVMDNRSAYQKQMAEKCRIREKELRQEALAEEGCQQYMREKDERMRAMNDMMGKKLQMRERRAQVVADMVAKQEQERIRKYEAADARITAMVRETKEAQNNKNDERKQQMQKDMAKSITADLEHKRRLNERKVEEERQQALKTLSLNKEADLIHWEKEKIAVQKQRDSRKAMDQELLQQMAQKQRQQQLQKEKEMENDIKSRDLRMYEDRQFQMYTKEVIEAAEKTNRNAIPIRRAANRGVGKGLGPIHGGFRANYLDPNSRCKPDYVGSAANDIKKLFKTPAPRLNHKKLGFV